jgi:hypothetical protein
MEKIKSRADKKGFNISSDISRNQFKSKKEEKLFFKLQKEYKRVKENIDSKTLKDELRYTYVKGVFRVTRPYVSDGIKKYEEHKDNDKPESGFKFNIKSALLKILVSVAIGGVLTSIVFQINTTKSIDGAFMIFAFSRLVLFLINYIMGKMQGDSYFESVVLDFVIKREFVIQKYLI